MILNTLRVHFADFAILYRALVQDGALPPGHSSSSRCSLPQSPLQPIVSTRTKSQLLKSSAAVWVHKFPEREDKKKVKLVRTAADQFALAALEKPRRYQTHLQHFAQDPLLGRTLRKTKGADGSVYWLGFSEEPIRPWSNSWRSKQGTHRFLDEDDAHRLSETEFVLVHDESSSLGWPSHAATLTQPKGRATDYLAARQCEPCTRNALKEAHLVQVFLHEMAGEVKLAGSLHLFSTLAPTKNSCRLLVKAKRRDRCSGCTHPGVSGEHRVRHQKYSVQNGDLLVDLAAKLVYLGFGHYRGFC